MNILQLESRCAAREEQKVESGRQVDYLSLGANPYLPTGYVLSTWWVLKQNTQYGPTASILITFVICPQFAHPDTHWVYVGYFQKVPTTEPTKGGLDLHTRSI